MPITILSTTAITGVPQRIHSANMVITELNGVELREALSKISWGVTVEGGEHVTAMGKRRPIGQTEGTIKPDNATLSVHAHKWEEFAQAWGGGAPIADVPANFVVKHIDDAPSAGVTALQAITVQPVLIQLIGCTFQKLGESLENGAAMFDVEVKPNEVLPLGKPLTAK